MHQQASDDSDANIRFKQAIQTSVGTSHALPYQVAHLTQQAGVSNKRFIRKPRAIAS